MNKTQQFSSLINQEDWVKVGTGLACYIWKRKETREGKTMNIYFVCSAGMSTSMLVTGWKKQQKNWALKQRFGQRLVMRPSIEALRITTRGRNFRKVEACFEQAKNLRRLHHSSEQVFREEVRGQETDAVHSFSARWDHLIEHYHRFRVTQEIMYLHKKTEKEKELKERGRRICALCFE